MFKRVLFLDLDDTICNTEEAYQKALLACFKYMKKLDPRLSWQHFLRLYYTARAAVQHQIPKTAASHNRFLYFQKMFELMAFTVKPKELLELYNLYWTTANNALKLKRNVLETLKILKKNNATVGLVTDLLAQTQMRKVKTLGIGEYLDFVVTSEEAGTDKPASEIFRLALAKANAQPIEAVMLGNNCLKDIEGANNAGISSVYLEEDFCSKAKYNIHDFKDILKIMKINGQSSKPTEGQIKFNYTWEKTGSLELIDIAPIEIARSLLYKIKLVGAYPNGVGYGNISIRHEKGFIITGTETGKYKSLKPEQYSFVKNWNFQKNHLTCAGPTVASSESLSHAAVYQSLPWVKAVIHVHDPKMWQNLLKSNVPNLMEKIPTYKTRVPATSAKTPYGTVAMTDEIKGLIKNTDLKNKKILVMAGHKEGVMAFGKDLDEAKTVLLSYYKK